MILLTFLVSLLAQADPIRIAVIDTGFDQSLTDDKVVLCPKGHFDFRTNTAAVGVTTAHGTAVASAIARGLQGRDYCLIIVQINLDELVDKNLDPLLIAKGIRKAVEAGAVAINVSITGPSYSYEELEALQEARKKALIYVAAGNKNKNLNHVCNSYPACYKLDTVIVVGALHPGGKRLKTSNYGSPVTHWYDGVIIVKETRWEGTSIASPRALARYVRYLLDKRERALMKPPLDD